MLVPESQVCVCVCVLGPSRQYFPGWDGFVLTDTRQAPRGTDSLCPSTVICHGHKHQLCQQQGPTQKSTCAIDRMRVLFSLRVVYLHSSITITAYWGFRDWPKTKHWKISSNKNSEINLSPTVGTFSDNMSSLHNIYECFTNVTEISDGIRIQTISASSVDFFTCEGLFHLQITFLDV